MSVRVCSNMCGTFVNVVHLFVIGPILLLSAYYQWQLPLYILGGGVMFIHGSKLISAQSKTTTAADGGLLGASYSVGGVAGGSLPSTACSSCSG